jgi:hypothetical protein
VLIGFGVVSVMAFVLNIPAPNKAITINTSHQRPIIPLIPPNEGQIVISNARTLAHQQKKATLIIHP